MGLLTETIEDSTHVTIVFKRLWIPYYLCLLALVLFVAQGFSKALQVQEIQYVVWGLASVGLLGIFYGYRLLSSLQMRGWSHIGGHKMSIRNPVAIQAQKTLPEDLDDGDLE